MSERKTVRARMSFEVDWEVPAEWNDEQVLFYFNGSSFCTLNLLEEALRKGDSQEGCTCAYGEITLVTEKTPLLK